MGYIYNQGCEASVDIVDSEGMFYKTCFNILAHQDIDK